MKSILFVLLVFPGQTATTDSLSAADAPPNVVLTMADDLGFSDLGCCGCEINTPNLDSLAKNGVRFRRFYNNAKCGASRVGLLMGASSFKASQNRYNNLVADPAHANRRAALAKQLKNLLLPK